MDGHNYSTILTTVRANSFTEQHVYATIRIIRAVSIWRTQRKQTFLEEAISQSTTVPLEGVLDTRRSLIAP